jgi:hypothetical protein
MEQEELEGKQHALEKFLEKWFGEVDERDPEIKEMFDYNLGLFNQELKWFLRSDEITNIVMRDVDRVFHKGKHTKRFSRKYLKKIDGMIIEEHRKPRRTCVQVRIDASNRKSVFYDFGIMNYFKTPRGVIYCFRQGVEFPELHFFTGHVFDRMNQRGATDEFSRMGAVWKVMRNMSTHDTASVFMQENKRASLAMENGLCLGHYGFHDYNLAYKFESKNGPTGKPAPKTLPVFFYMTYVHKNMLSQKQLQLIERMKNPKKYEGGPSGEPAATVGGETISDNRGQTDSRVEAVGEGHTREHGVHRQDSQGG